MGAFRDLGVLLLFLIIYSLFIPEKAEAYIDPATGSYVLQLLLAAFFASSLAVKIYWKKIKTFWVKYFSKKQEDGQKDS